jgi:4-amino-4-deoxy-L-arabinose transferase-like glycosyltransferase
MEKSVNGSLRNSGRAILSPPEESTWIIRRAWETVWIILLAFGLLVLFSGAPTPQRDGDVPFYASAAKSILATGDWLRPRHPVWYVDVPPLTIWLMAISLRLGGDTDAALRLWHLALTALLVLATYRIARLAAGREESLLVALLLLTTWQIPWWSLAPKQDIPLALFMGVAFYAYLRYRESGRWSMAAAAGAALALAVLSKGAGAVPLFGAVVVGDLVLSRVRRPPAARGNWAGAAAAGIFLAIAAPWYAARALGEGGRRFVRTFLLRGGAARFILGRYPRDLPYILSVPLYLPLLALGALPWTGLLPGGIREGWRSLREGPPSLRLCALWFGLVLLVLSLSPGPRVDRYLLPAYPPLAVLCARFLCGALQSPRGLRGAASTALVLTAVLLPVGWVLLRRGAEPSAPYVSLFGPGLAAFVLAVTTAAVLAWRDRPRPAIALLAGGVLTMFLLFNVQMTRHGPRLWPWRETAATIARVYRAGDRVLVVGEVNGESNHLNYYLEDRGPVARIASAAEFESAWRDGGVVALVAPAEFARLAPTLRPTVLLRTPLGWALIANR